MSIYITPGLLSLSVIEDDPADDMFLEAAVEGKADYIVSGNTHLRELRCYKNILIVAPTEFVQQVLSIL